MPAVTSERSDNPSNAPDYVQHARLRRWVAEIAALAKPDGIVWCDGSQAEYDDLCAQLVQGGAFLKLDQELRPNSFLARARHLRALASAQQSLAVAGDALPHWELFAEELRLAQESLNQITGEFTSDDLLGEIFARFCIGK